MAAAKEIIARLRTHGKDFEIILDAQKFISYKEGKLMLKDALIGQGVFRGLKTMKKIEDLPMKPGGGKAGEVERVSPEELAQIFGTADFQAVAKRIVDEGEVQLTVEQRRELVEAKKRAIIALIAQQAVDPRTKSPHPPQRIELAMEQSKASVDPFRKPEEQVKDVVKAIQAIMPLSFEKKKIALKIPVQHASQARYIIQSMGTILRDEWSSHWIVEVEVPAGLVEQLFSKLNALTKGEMESKMLG